MAEHLIGTTQARVTQSERFRTNTRWGQLTASTVTSVLNRAAQGDVADYIDLCEFAITTDPLLASLYDSRITRVVQADFTIAPNPYGDKALAKQGADVVSEFFGRIQDWHQVQRDLLHAIAVGCAFGENAWKYDKNTDLNYVDKVEFRHGHRFRFDEVWEPRLYDQGTRRSPASQDGEALIEHKWTTHEYRVVAGYPGIGGLMRPSFYRWLFRRWVDQWWVVSTERYGMPHMSVKVSPNTPASTRSSIRSQLEDYVSEHVGVFEEGVELLIDATANATKSYESYKEYMAFTKEELTTLWLGSSDAASPGPNGSRASQETRTGALLDPRMVSDGMNLGSSLQKTLIRSALQCNKHRFEVPIEQVPVPSYKFRTQEDEAQVEKVPPSELIELARAVKSGEVSPQQAIEIVLVSYPQLPREQAQKLISSGAQSPAPKTIAVPAQPTAKPTDKPTLSAPAGEDVQSQALNGAQLAELKQLAIDVRQGLLPRDSAIALVKLAVPGADDAAIAALIPVADPSATPAPKQPPPFAPQKEAA